MVQIIIDADGLVRYPKVISAEPEGIFEQTALDTVVKYKFIPARRDGINVACYSVLPVTLTPPKEQVEN
ncbi:MAG: energy transducer TonB [Desulfobacteraceae bacterium]|jgi:protein TonB